ncbi:hypothetical protein [endosymbiont of Ridgeia piscesae]|jgi:hypothetical protein|uniref:Uncharacterized protein n=1 Tax=endosymbiont of Ridgeia piscesae TaxID=54398 RepID=A0A0T5Z8J4_9GAMM|nr:hypothetical protein [endosymbiont of Ridgeia piscesae]KRT54983.1 hypothetical protein Ga0074115_11238 [endosymbiont of Ridgeia piscesae]KRT59043.1 hypothetical protein Ga0076813_14742 [endosymbiont of Ridgeia piscesae]
MEKQSHPEQLDAIYSMISRGQQSVRMDPHTLLIWGGAGGFLAIFTDLLITDARFPERWSQALAVFLLVGGVLTTAGLFDYRFTRRLRWRQDRTLSFVQRQLTKVWWILMGLGVLMSVATMFYGGGYMIFAAWIFLVGLALVIHGLFSEQPLEWYGASMMLASVLLLALGADYQLTQWFAAALFGAGMPLLGLILRYQPQMRRLVALSALVGWGLLVCLMAEAGYQMTRVSFDSQAEPIRLADFAVDQARGEQIVSLPVGSPVPLYLTWEGNLLQSSELEPIPLRLSQPLEILMRDGVPEGHYRIGGGEWKEISYNFRVPRLTIQALIDKETGPRIDTSLRVEIGE